MGIFPTFSMWSQLNGKTRGGGGAFVQSYTVAQLVSAGGLLGLRIWFPLGENYGFHLVLQHDLEGGGGYDTYKGLLNSRPNSWPTYRLILKVGALSYLIWGIKRAWSAPLYCPLNDFQQNLQFKLNHSECLNLGRYSIKILPLLQLCV